MKNKYKHWNGWFYRALETKDFVYYVNYQEGDENGCVHMYNMKGKLVSDNYHAYNDMFGVIEDKTYIWVSRTMKRNIKLSLEVSN